MHLYVVRLELDKISRSQLAVFNELRANGIGVNIHYIPVHIQPHFQSMGFISKDFPKAMKYYGEAISLPMYQGLSEEQQDKVVAILQWVLAK